MAITIEREKKGIGATTALAVIGGALALLGATYYLFFAPVPGIEKLSPPEVQKASQVATIDLAGAVRDIQNSPVLLNVLKSHVGLPAQGSFVRDNPFLSFLVAQPPSATGR